MYLYLSIHFFIQNVSLKLIWYCWSNLNKNFRFEANLTTKRTVNASCLSLDCVIGQYTSCTHVVVAHFLESTLLLLFFHLFLWTFRPTLGSPSFICPSFRFVTHIALSWLSFNNNNTYIAPISILLYIYIYIYQLFSFPLYWSSVYSVKVFVKLGSDLRLLNSECFHGHSVKSK